MAQARRRLSHAPAGFTLIELSIVLVIIGLIVGGVMVGQNLIAAAETRAQITQIEKYNSAVNTFRSKFNYLPGDILLSAAAQFGFTTDATCTGAAGQRNGDGAITSYTGAIQFGQANGETGYFWQDLGSNAAGNLIDGTFPSGGAPAITCGLIPVALTTAPGTHYLGDYLPTAKLGHGQFLYVYNISGANWYGLSAVTQVATNNIMLSNSTMSVIQAYNIDQKVDDGQPTTGNVVAQYINGSNSVISQAPNNATSGGDATTCYDTTTGRYSITVSNGNGGNCALSFRFQ